MFRVIHATQICDDKTHVVCHWVSVFVFVKGCAGLFWPSASTDAGTCLSTPPRAMEEHVDTHTHTHMYWPGVQEAHVDAPASAEVGPAWCVSGQNTCQSRTRSELQKKSPDIYVPSPALTTSIHPQCTRVCANTWTRVQETHMAGRGGSTAHTTPPCETRAPGRGRACGPQHRERCMQAPRTPWDRRRRRT